VIAYFYKEKDVPAVLRENYLAEIIEEMARIYHEQGNHLKAACAQLRAAARFGVWLQRNGIPKNDVEYRHVIDFFEAFSSSVPVKKDGTRRPPHAEIRNGVRFAFFLLQKRYPFPAVPETPVEADIREYRQYLERYRGLAPSTINGNCRFLGRFLRETFPQGAVDLETLTASAVHDHIMRSLRVYLPKTVQSYVAGSLRRYFRYKKLRGLDVDALQAGIPHIHAPQTCLSPTILSEEDLDELCHGFDRATAIGRRDYAAARCMIDLAARAGDVAELLLDDIKWRQGLIRLRNTKGNAPVWLPLPQALGDALADYLRHGRPKSGDRHVFLRHIAPVGPGTPGMLANAMRYAYRRTGLASRFGGTHILRHTSATRMRRAGVPFKTLADVMGHSRLQTTALYAQIDLPTLRAVAQPWPEGLQ
jgi:integrase